MYIFKILLTGLPTNNSFDIFQRVGKELLQIPSLLMGLPTKLDCWYISESSKKITANITATTNIPTELQIVFCW